jgi:hypothetical protein
MSKRQLIDAIRNLNPSAPMPFLSQFEEGELQAYLARLKEIESNRIQFGPALTQAKVRVASMAS